MCKCKCVNLDQNSKMSASQKNEDLLNKGVQKLLDVMKEKTSLNQSRASLCQAMIETGISEVLDEMY